MKKRYWFVIATAGLALIIALLSLGDKIMEAVWDFHNGFVGVPRR